MAQAAEPSEEIIRKYLEVLEDPSRAIDHDAIREQEEVVSSAEDVIDRLHALATLERIREPDTTEIEGAFVAVVQAWASVHQVPASAFIEVGVAPEVLRRAGFDVAQRRSKRVRRADSTSRERPRSRVTQEVVRVAIMNYATEFTIADVAEKLGANNVTVRKAAEGLVNSGDLRKLPPRVDHVGPGRAPARYEVISR